MVLACSVKHTIILEAADQGNSYERKFQPVGLRKTSISQKVAFFCDDKEIRDK